VAELEIPPGHPRGRHDLRALDADPEAAPGGRRAFFDRRLEGRRPHRGRRALRRGRGRRQGQAGSGRPARAHAGAGAAGRRRERTETSPPQIANRQWDPARAAANSGASRGVCQTGTGSRAVTAQKAPPLIRVRRARGRARAAGGAHPRDGSAAGSRGRPRDGNTGSAGQDEGSGHRLASLARKLGRGFQGLQVLDHAPRELSRGRGAARHAHLLGSLEPLQLELFEIVDEVGGLVAQLLDHLDQAQ